MGIVHLPVMLGEVVEFLRPEKGMVYIDATVGLGGHASGVLGHMRAKGLLVGIDRDEEALGEARKKLDDERCILKKAKFSEMDKVLEELGVGGADGVLFDFGISMLQMKSPERGFSFNSDAPLDMRMDRTSGLAAARIVNTYPEPELERILREYGEEMRARRIAKAIVRARGKKPIETCRELSAVIESALGRWGGRMHPATRTFQALRIAVNDELGEIKSGLNAALGLLAPEGRIVAISYHSLEDRIVKNFMRDSARSGLLKMLTPKPLRPAPEEMVKNPSARSAKLRAAQRAEGPSSVSFEAQTGVLL